MTKEDLKTQALALIDQAYALGFTEGKASVPASPPADAPVVSPSQPSLADEYPLTNPAVAAFLADPAYDAPGFATGSGLSVVDKYIQSAIEGDTQSPTERPAPVPLDGCTIFDQNGSEIPAAAGIRNLIPGRTYIYSRTITNGHEVGGRFHTTGTVRMIHTADTHPILNIRDLGGYPCEGGHVAYGRIIRCGRIPKELKKADTNAQILRNLGITAEVSFSTSWPARADLGWKAYTYSICAYAYILQNPTKYKETFTRILAEAEAGGCTLIHCQAGADRTGTVAALILALLGVSEADIIKDWELTSFCAWFNRKRISDWAIRTADPKMKAKTLEEAPYGELRQLFQKLKESYGTKGQSLQQQVTSFLTAKVGLTTAQLTRLKKALIQP